MAFTPNKGGGKVAPPGSNPSLPGKIQQVVGSAASAATPPSKAPAGGAKPPTPFPIDSGPGHHGGGPGVTPPPGSTGGVGGTTNFADALSGANRDAFVALNDLFTGYGLGSLAPKIYDFIKKGYSADTISILLQQTPEYKQRFAANDARLKAGLPVLSPAQYLATEQSYRQIMQQSGLPKSFYDQPSDFENFLANDMSPTELNSRVQLATQATALASPAYKQALNQMGIDDGHLAAYFLDQNKALPMIQKAAATAAIGAEALQRGMQFNQTDAAQLAAMGITQSQAASGYAKIGQEMAPLQSLGQIYGQAWNQHMAEQDVFVGGTAATQQRENLINEERFNFSGNTGAAQRGLAALGSAGAH